MQGNSNSLATVDTNAGFVGQAHVHMGIVFIFSVINTFNGQILALMLLITSLIEDSKRWVIFEMEELNIIKYNKNVLF